MSRESDRAVPSALLIGAVAMVALVAIAGWGIVRATGDDDDRATATQEFAAMNPTDVVDQLSLRADVPEFREGDTVQVTKLDRLARNTRHLLEVSEYLQNKGVALNILNIGINTATPTGKLMLTMIGAIATFEREMMLERQAEGIALAKLKGKYKGRKATARSKSQEVIDMLAQGLSKPEISRQLGIGITSIYRIVRNERPELLDK